MRPTFHACRALTIASFLFLAPAPASEPYRLPPPEIVQILEAPPLPAVSLDPTRSTVLLLHRENLPPIADLAQPMLRLAGSRLNPRTSGPHGVRGNTGFTLKRIADGVETPVSVPRGLDLGGPSWSPDGSRFIFTATRDNGIELWVANAATGEARALTGPNLNAASGQTIRWMPDGRHVLVKFIPAARPPMPERPLEPTGPITQETSGRTAPVRTFQDLLQDSFDEALFDWIAPSQLALVNTDTGARTDIGSPAIYTSVDPSPNGEFLLVTRTVRPYSYLVTWGSFPEVIELWTTDGKPLRELVRVPLRDETPIQGVQKGPRRLEWIDTADATLTWVEALDEGDPRNKVPHRDRLIILPAPFTAQPVEALRVTHRFSGISWLETPGLALVAEFDRDRRWTTTWLYRFDGAIARLERTTPLFDRSIQDRYGDPGSPLSTRLPNGRSVVRVENGSIFLRGSGATPTGDRPFLDRLSLADSATERLWRCAEGELESVVDAVAPGAARFITVRESPNDPPNYYMRTSEGRATRITSFADPAPQLRDIKKELVRYKRADGVDLSATLYLPASHTPGTRLPLLVWAYPQEFNDPDTAGQVSGSPNRFTMFGGISHLLLLTQGYAIMDNATMPVIGSPETMNDTFVEQIVAGAKAAIDKAVELGVADRHRVAVGGHSYGAFMTANLLAHSDLFRAGIARSGAYNRTLTPFGFQGERRTYWEAVETYTRLSPFTYAHQIKAPILLIHGQIDNNAGTFPIQSERLYHAIKGHGGTARLVMLPFESHGYRARESVMHTHAEMVEWLDRFVKNAPAPSESEAAGINNR